MRRTLTYRGLIEHLGKRKISLETKDGSLGYTIIKFELMPKVYGGSSNELESTVKVFMNEPEDIDSIVNFDDMDLLAVATLGMDANPSLAPMNMFVSFDAITFNQNLWITHSNIHADENGVNYYLELEQFDISGLESATLTLKNMRNRVN